MQDNRTRHRSGGEYDMILLNCCFPVAPYVLGLFRVRNHDVLSDSCAEIHCLKPNSNISFGDGHIDRSGVYLLYRGLLPTHRSDQPSWSKTRTWRMPSPVLSSATVSSICSAPDVVALVLKRSVSQILSDMTEGVKLWSREAQTGTVQRSFSFRSP